MGEAEEKARELEKKIRKSGIKIKSVEAGSVEDFNNGKRKYMDLGNATLDYSLFTVCLQSIYLIKKRN